MREIIFRAKRSTDNEWIFGWYAEIEGYYAIIDDVQNYHMIDIETLGQLTGLYDNNGKEIYEGDIVAVNDTASSYGYVKGVVIYNYCDFSIYLYEQEDDLPLFNFRNRNNIEVIGNIYDNKELLDETQIKK